MKHNAYSLYHKFGLWYLEGLLENCRHTFIEYDQKNMIIRYTNQFSENTVEIASIRRLVGSMLKIKLCGTIEKAQYIYDQNERLQNIRYDLYDAIEDYKACMAFKLA